MDADIKEEFVKIGQRFDKLNQRLDDFEEHVGDMIQALASHLDAKLTRFAERNNLWMVEEPKFQYKPRNRT